MTAIAPPRPPRDAPDGAAGPPVPPPAATARPTVRTQPRYLAPAEVGLVAVTIAAVLGFNRVFADGNFLVPLLVVAVVAHALTWAGRQRGLGVAVTALIAVPVFGLVASWLFFWDTTLPVIPSGSTWDATGQAFTDAWATFQTIIPPAPTDTGFVLAAAIAVYFAAFLADWAAFRLWSSLEAVVPALTLFIFCSLFGAGEQRELATGVFAAAALGFLLLHRTAQRETSAGWLTTDVDRGSNASARVGAALAAVAVLAGVVAGPHLPTAQSPQLIPWKGDGRNPVRTVISPLVNIRDRLLNQSDNEMFTVEADQEAYWRLMSLDTFKKESWSASGQFESAGDELVDPAPDAESVEVRQTFRITGLSTAWAPVAFVPTRLEQHDRELRLQKESATLIVGQQEDQPDGTTDGMTYTVVSEIPTFDPGALASVQLDDLPDEFEERYLQLPADFSAKARTIAEEQTREAGSPYAKALALQKYFSANPEFTYSPQVDAGHGEAAIDAFLTNKRGYCEQFAGTYAAMARSIGLPARVAVGFTQGEQDPTNPRRWRVTGRYAHAWPEVYLGSQFGWVPFEPTPGRGAPRSAPWTEVQPNQEGNDGLPVAPGGSTAPGVTQPSPDPANPTPGPSQEPGGLATGDIVPTTSGPTADDDPGLIGLSTPGQAVVTGGLSIGLLALAVVVYAAIILAIRSSLRRRRRERARNASAEVLVAWEELLEHLALVGIRHARAETPEELAVRAGPYLGELADDVHRLASIVDAASFAPDVLDPAEAEQAAAISAAVEAHLRGRTTALRQWQERLDPRTLRAERTPQGV